MPKRLTRDEFINNALKIHKGVYVYSKVNYVNAKTKVIITCKIHGDFEQKPEGHIYGQGCPKCGIKKQSQSHTYTTKEFINKSILVHGNKYSYKKSKYTKAREKIIIHCYKHGDFEQIAYKHLSGNGCPRCGNELKRKYQKNNPSGWGISLWENSSLKSKYFDSFKVYIIECWNNEERFYKIGRTYNTLKKRFNGKKTMPYNYVIIKSFIFKTAKEAFDYENELKRLNKEFKYVPKIKFRGSNECFYKINL